MLQQVGWWQCCGSSPFLIHSENIWTQKVRKFIFFMTNNWKISIYKKLISNLFDDLTFIKNKMQPSDNQQK